MDNDAYHLGISFQSTHPCGGRRLNAYTVPFLLLFQSTHPMRGTTSDCRINRNCRPISIHAPHAGCDLFKIYQCWASSIFQSTHPMRGATVLRAAQTRACCYFNPRTPCGVRPEFLFLVGEPSHYFNPRTPCGVRHETDVDALAELIFQSTHPMRGATFLNTLKLITSLLFQSTHPMRGATLTFLFDITAVSPFQSTHPMRGATSSS